MFGINGGSFDGVTCVAKINKIDSLYGTSVFDVEAGNDAFGKHKENVEFRKMNVEFALLNEYFVKLFFSIRRSRRARAVMPYSSIKQFQKSSF